jgi:hypothetical protein
VSAEPSRRARLFLGLLPGEDRLRLAGLVLVGAGLAPPVVGSAWLLDRAFGVGSPAVSAGVGVGVVLVALGAGVGLRRSGDPDADDRRRHDLGTALLGVGLSPVVGLATVGPVWLGVAALAAAFGRVGLSPSAALAAVFVAGVHLLLAVLGAVALQAADIFYGEGLRPRRRRRR